MRRHANLSQFKEHGSWHWKNAGWGLAGVAPAQPGRPELRLLALVHSIGGSCRVLKLEAGARFVDSLDCTAAAVRAAVRA